MERAEVGVKRFSNHCGYPARSFKKPIHSGLFSQCLVLVPVDVNLVRLADSPAAAIRHEEPSLLRRSCMSKSTASRTIAFMLPSLPASRSSREALVRYDI